MEELILHHFDLSPFSEKIRVVLGLKQAEWSSVQIPMVMPKPDLFALTGGYRKTPVLQIGADIYCDTQRIARELEQRLPEPSLFPDGRRGLAMALGLWSDGGFFTAGSALSMATNDQIPEAMQKDRRAFFSHIDFEEVPEKIPHYYAQFAAHAQLIEDQLAAGDAFLSGGAAGWIDILAYFNIWMARGNLANVEQLLGPFPKLPDWEHRMRAFGHGKRHEISAQDALDIACSSAYAAPAGVREDNSEGFARGDNVTVTPTDYGAVPVHGVLVTLDNSEIAIVRNDARAGEVCVHFPRIGYEVAAVANTESG